jgi:hypothetical protein
MRSAAGLAFHLNHGCVPVLYKCVHVYVCMCVCACACPFVSRSEVLFLQTVFDPHPFLPLKPAPVLDAMVQGHRMRADAAAAILKATEVYQEQEVRFGAADTKSCDVMCDSM